MFEALQLHRQGRMEQAEQLYREVLAVAPRHAEALHMLGIVALQQRRFDEADRLIAEALSISPDSAEALSNRATALRALGRLDDALASYDQALAVRPGFAEALHNRGNVLKGLGRPEEALDSYDRALAVRPGFVQALQNRAHVLKELGRLEDAIASYNEALSIRPDDAEALNIRAAALLEQGRPREALSSCDGALAIRPDFVEALNNRAVALGQLGRPDEALTSFDRALELKPDYVPALSNRGKTLLDIYRAERSDEALASYDRALAIKPDDAGLLINRAHVLAQLGRPQDALASSDRALAIRPGSAEALNNRAVALVGLSRLEEALASHAAAVAARPDFAEAHWNEALCRLALGDYATGWEKYEWRWRCKFMAKAKRDFVEPLWLGKEDLSGKTVFLHAEQGLGDTLQFCRYAPAVAAKGATVTLGVPAPLISLLRTLPGVERVVSEYDPSWNFDFHCPLMSLPLAFATRVETIPAPVPYLWANPFRVAAWRERLAKLDGIKVGLVWAGSGKVRVVDLRLTRLEQMRLLGAVDGVSLVSLQKGEPASQTRPPPPGLAIHDWTDELADFADTAALIEALDLVISVDTAVAHLAGALGKPVWVLLHNSPDWRWLLEREDTPWYPTMRLFTQPSPGDWDSVAHRASSELRDFVTDRLTFSTAGLARLAPIQRSEDAAGRPSELAARFSPMPLTPAAIRSPNCIRPLPDHHRPQGNHA
jgi:tetratricopeptide (TPR) repeat protein